MAARRHGSSGDGGGEWSFDDPGAPGGALDGDAGGIEAGTSGGGHESPPGGSDGGVPRPGTWLSQAFESAGASANVASAIMGSGILGLPLAARYSGVGLFVCVLLVCMLLANAGAKLLLASAKATGVYSYEALGADALGRRGRGVVAGAILVQNTGAMTSYMMTIRDAAPNVASGLAKALFGVSLADDSIWRDRSVLTATVATLVVLPLACMRRVSGLAFASSLSVLIGATFAVFVTWRHSASPDLSDICDVGPAPRGHWWILRPLPEEGAVPGIFMVFPTVCFAFVCHTMLLPVADELVRKHEASMALFPAAAQAASSASAPRRVRRALDGAFLACTCCYAVAAIIGYLTFLETTDADLLLNYPPNDRCKADRYEDVTQLVRGLFAFSIVLSVPLIQYPARRTLTLLLFGEEALGEMALADDQVDELGDMVFSPARRTTSNRALSVINSDRLLVSVGSAAGGSAGSSAEGLRKPLLALGGDTHMEARRVTGDGEGDTSERGGGRELSTWARCGLSVAIIGTVTTLALAVPQISMVFSVAGATSSPTLMFVLPGVIASRVAPGYRAAGFVLAGTGVVMGACCLSAVIISLATRGSS